MNSSEQIQPLVSVLVATYNQEAYIAQTLDCILMQQCSFPFEIVIGEDCSSDKTRDICLEYQARYPDQIVLCLNERNKGLLDNYFDIFLKSRGLYIADCGGDDYWLNTHKLQEQVDLLEQHPEVTLVAGNWSVFMEKSGLLTESPKPLKNDWFQKDCFGKKAVVSYLNEDVIPRVVLATSCFRRDVAINAYRSNPELFRSKDVTCEDLPLTLCLLLKGPIYFKKENWLVYRVMENSMSHSENVNKYMSGFAFKTFKQTVLLAKTLDVRPDEISTYVDKWIGNFTLHAFIVKDHELMNSVLHFARIHGIRFKVKPVLLYICMSVSGLYDGCRWIYTKLKCPELG